MYPHVIHCVLCYVDVFLSLNRTVIANNGILNTSDIGSSNNNALLCHTNRRPPYGSINSGGDWYGPDGIRVDDTIVPGVIRNRDRMVVRLKRTNTDTAPEGIYWCSVEDAASTLQTIYVGLYSTGGGNVWFLNEHYTVTLYTQAV